MTVSDLPALNASLNGLATLLLLAGFWAVKIKRDPELHKKIMVSALAVSAAFLASYLIYHAQAGSRPFPADHPLRTLYLWILWPHIVLAALMVPLIFLAVRRAFQGNIESHRKIVRFTYPVWLYVSVTGVVIYYMLYHLAA